jgi:hypothetical protein
MLPFFLQMNDRRLPRCSRHILLNKIGIDGWRLLSAKALYLAGRGFFGRMLSAEHVRHATLTGPRACLQRELSIGRPQCGLATG